MKQKQIINREISWLSFNHRVLQEAADPEVPLFERIKFLGIFSNNLDEFFKVRVATIKRMIDVQEKNKKVEGEKPKKVLAQIQKMVMQLQEEFNTTYHQIRKELARENILIINESQLTTEQGQFVKEYFHDKVMPALSLVMLHNVKHFPYLKDKSIYLATKLTSKEPQVETEYALIEIPTAVVSRFLVLPSIEEKQFVILLDDVIRYCLKEIFAIFHFDSFEAYTVKLTRDAELDLDNDLSQSFLEKVSKGVSGRKKGQPVRFVYDSLIPRDILDFLKEKLELDDDDNLIPGARYHNFKDFMHFPKICGKHLEYKPTPPIDHHLYNPYKSILELISEQDIMLHPPYHKFSNFINFLREASIDPYVTSIKITLYRVASFSKIINALINAARNGKNVTVVIELQARFDEKANIYWSKKLEEVGVNVLFGVKGLKVHCKLCLISRKENKRLVHYAAVSTGNFHEGNAAVYSDVTLLTKDKRITKDVQKVFTFFENVYKNFNYRHLLVSPHFMRRRLIALIEKEIKNVKAGRNAYIILKINNLIDKDMVKKLYQASVEGVKIKLIVRGICSIFTLGDELGGNIEAISIVDKYLEHTRIFVFCNDDDELYFISSADWMTRNLDHRIEVTCPIYDPAIKKELRDLLEIQLKDNVKSRILNDQQTNPYKISDEGVRIRSQMELYKYYKNQLVEKKSKEPHTIS